ncbi:MAG: hypothetical protein AD073_000224 [Mycoplasmataceae bacterium]|nr:MAG: hypothetical protein AD073_000224 [Mycoplasmataceae bacterium]
MKKQNNVLCEDREENLLIQKEEHISSFSEGEEINENSRIFFDNFENNASMGFSNFIQNLDTDIDFKNRILLEKTEKENKRLKRYSLQLEEKKEKIELKLDKYLDELELIKNRENSMNSIFKEFEKKFNEKKEFEKEYFRNFKDLRRSSVKYFYQMLILQGDVRKLEQENSDLKRREVEYLIKRIENLEISNESLKNERTFPFKNWDFLFFYLILFILLMNFLIFFLNNLKNKDTKNDNK